MSAFSERRDQDVLKLRDLARRSNGRISIGTVTGNPISEVKVVLRYKTAPSTNYPNAVQDESHVTIKLSGRYPFEAPSAFISTPVFHPNVFTSGQVCLGNQWFPTQGLDLLVEKLIQIITFDPIILNAASPANSSALSWYTKAVRENPGAFPTERCGLSRNEQISNVKWKEKSDSPPLPGSLEKVVISCPKCSVGLRLAAGKKGTVTCPKCSSEFEVQT
jgi:ubiquitin-protein ligase